MDKQIIGLSKKNSRRRLLKRVAALMCTVVLLITMNGLKRNANTLERIPSCGMREHQHSSDCYDSSGALVCGKTEHVHTDACYQEGPSDADRTDYLKINADAVEGLVDEVGAIELADLQLDAGLALNDSLVVNDVPAYEEPVAVENPVYELGNGAMLSAILANTSIRLADVVDVGVVDYDGTQAGLLHIEKVKGDYQIKTATDFDWVDLAVILADEMKTVKLTGGRVTGGEGKSEEAAAPAIDEHTEEREQPLEEDAPVIKQQPEVDQPPVEEQIILEAGPVEEAAPVTWEQPADVIGQPAEEQEQSAEKEAAPVAWEQPVDVVGQPAEEQEQSAEKETAPVTWEQPADVIGQPADEQPADEQGEESVGEQPADEQGEQPAEDQPADEQGEESVGEQPADEQSEQPAEDQPADEQGEKPVDEQPADEQGEESVGEQPADEQGEQPAEDQPADEEGEKPVEEQPAEEQGEESVGEQPADEQGEQAVEEQPADEEGEQPAEDQPAVEQDEEPADDQPADEQGEQPADDQPADEQGEQPADEQPDVEQQPVDEQGEEPVDEQPIEEQPGSPQILYPAQTFSGSAHNVNVSVTAPEGAFPEGTVMTVKAVYDQDTIGDIRDTVNDDFTKVKSVRAVDITFIYNGAEIEPLVPISVVMSGPEIKEEQAAVVVHVDDEGSSEVVDTSSNSKVAVEMPATSDPEGVQSAIENTVAGQSAEGQTSEQIETDASAVAFESDSFSIYAYVVTETIETHYIDASGSSWKITVAYGQEAGIPNGASLRVSEVTGVAAEECLAQTAEMLENQKITLARFFDITILDREGNEVQPEKAVEVRVEIEGNDDTVKAVHFDEEGLEVLHADKQGDDAVTFDAKSFSVYGIVYTVDFEYTDTETGKSFAWSFPGRGRYAINEIMSMIGLHGELEDISLVCIVGDEEEGALYLVQEEQWWLQSDIAFDEVYVLTLVVDGKEYVIRITDEQVDTRVTAEVYFLDTDGTRTSDAETESGNTLNARINLSNSNANNSEDAYVKVSLAGLDDYVKLNERFTPNAWGSITFRDMTTGAQYSIGVYYNTTDNSIIYRVPPGATGIAALSFTVPNGITENNKTLTLTPTLVDENFAPITPEENDVIGKPASGKWTSTFGWDPVQKYVNNAKENTVVVTDNNGTPVINSWLRYDYIATSQNRDETGVRWTDEAIIQDTLTLPTHMSFTGTYTCDPTTGRIYIVGAPDDDNILFGLTLKPNMQCTALAINGNTITYTIKVTNTNNSRTDGLTNELSSEMDNISYITELNAAGITLASDYITGRYYGEEIVNKVNITEKPNKGSDCVTSNDQVKTKTKQDEGFKIDKSSNQDGKYVQAGATIDYTIRVTNTGTVAIAAADSVITDTLPSAIYLTDTEIARLQTEYGDKITINGNTITFCTGDLAPNAWSEVVIHATVRDSKALEQAGYTNESAIANTASYRGLSDYVASKLHAGAITSEKTSSWSSGTALENGQTVDFTLTAKNETDYPYTGEVTLTDDLPKYMTVTLFDVSGNDITATTYAQLGTHSSGCYVKDSSGTLVPATVVINSDGSARITVNKTDGLAAKTSYSIVLTATYDESKVEGKVDDNGNIRYTNNVNVNNSQSHTDIEVKVGKIDVDKYVSGATTSGGSTATQPYSDRTVVTYTIHVTNDSNNPYRHDIVVTDTMPKGLVPMGLTVGGTLYNTWQDFVNAFGWSEQTATIYDGNDNPQSVKVVQVYNGLKLTWVISNNESDPVTSKYITYKAQVRTDELVNQTTGLQELENTVNVVGREDKEIIVVDVKGVEISKKIVGPNDELLDTIQIGPGSVVTYELTIENPEGLNTTVTGITDFLPHGDSSFPLSYWQLGTTVLVDETTTGKNEFYTNAVAYTNNDGNYGKKYWFDNSHNLRFGDITVTSDITRLVQRITLKYPDDAEVLHTMFVGPSWSGRQQKNKYSITGFKPVEVDHTEVVHKKYYAQKSVIGLAKDVSYNFVPLSSKDLFRIGDVTNVFYTVLVANTGTGVLHINSLTDILPAELSFAGIAANDYNAGTHTYNGAITITTTDQNNNPNYVCPTGYTGLAGVKVTASQPTGNTVLFTLNDGTGIDLPEKTILAFDVECTLKNVTLTNGQAITNTLQASLDSDAQLSKVNITTQRTHDNDIQNNGGCEVVSNDGTTQVAESSVTIHPSNIAVPGILKEAIAYKSQDDTNWTELNDHTTSINSQSNVKWKITLYNDGAVPLDAGYTMTDEIYGYHQFIDNVNLENSVVSFKINGNDVALTGVTIAHDVTTNKENYKKYNFTFPAGETYAIPAGGKAELELVTTFTDVGYVGQLDNEAVFYPVQSFDANRVTRGQLVKNEAGTEYIGVSSMDYVNMLGDGATMSYKVVKEKNNPTNVAYGYNIANGTNYITVDDTDQLVTYTNHVQNLSDASFKEFVMIDRMPEIGDKGVVNAHEARGSEYSMDFAQPINLSLTFRNSDGTQSISLAAEDYTIDYSTATSYSTEDWAGTSEWSSDSTGAKSFRLKLNAVSLTQKINEIMHSAVPEAVFPSMWVLEVSYDGKLSADGTPGQYAWNSFGYHLTTLADVSLQAEPTKVGVRLKPLPVLKKQVVDRQGVDQGVDISVLFTYRFYEGAHTLEEIASLSPIWETTLYQGQAVKLQAKKTLNGVVTGHFTEGQAYTVVEQLTDGYALVGYEKDGLTQTTEGYCVFTYSNEMNTTIVCKNQISGFAPEASKVLRAKAPRTLKNQEFSFTLKALSNVDLTDLAQVEVIGDTIQTASNDASGHVQFDIIEYTEAGTYYYLLQEVAGSDTSVIYDDAKYLVKVEVAEQGDRLVSTGTYYKATDSDQYDPIKAISGPLASGVVPDFINTESTQIKVKKVWADDANGGSATMVLYRTTGASAAVPSDKFVVTINAERNNTPAGSGNVVVSYTGDGGDTGNITLNNTNGWTNRTIQLNRGEVYSFTYTPDGSKVTGVNPASTTGVSDAQTISLNVTANEAAQYTYTFTVPSEQQPANGKGSVKVTMNGQTATLNSANNWTASFTLTEETEYTYTALPGDGFVTAVSPASGSGMALASETINLSLTNAAQTMDIPVGVTWDSDPDAGTTVTVTFTADGQTDQTVTLSGSTWSTTKTLARLDGNGNLITWNVNAAVSGAENASVSGAPATISDSGSVALTGTVARGMNLTVNTPQSDVNTGSMYKARMVGSVLNYNTNDIVGAVNGYTNKNSFSSLDVKFDNGDDIYYVIVLWASPLAITTDLNEAGYSTNAKEDVYTTRTVVYFKAQAGDHEITLTKSSSWDVQKTSANALSSNRFLSASNSRLSVRSSGTKSSAPALTTIKSNPTPLSSGAVTFYDDSVGGSGAKAFKVIQGKDLPAGAEIASDIEDFEQTISDSCTWSNLPAVDADGNPIYYYVVEKEAAAMADDMSVRYAYTYNTSGDPTSGIKEVTITNTAEKKTGDLSVTKTVGAGGDQNKKFSFTVTLSNTSINGTYGDMTFTNGVASFELSHNQTATATGLPVGTSYTVVETSAAGYTATYTGETGTIQANQTANATVSNSYASTGSVPFKAKKTLEGGTLTKNQFTFTLVETDSNGNALSGGVTQTKKNEANGDIIFDNVTLTSTDTRYFIIKESITGTDVDGSIIYDTHVQKITVSVRDNGAGHLIATKDPAADDGYDACFTNTKKGALKLTKLVTVNGASTTDNVADGVYTFSVVGPASAAQADQVTKSVQVTVTNGVAAAVILQDLVPGDYTVTETGLNGLTLTAIDGGKVDTASVANRSVTMTVTAGDTTPTTAAAIVSFTNNKVDKTDITAEKKWVSGSADMTTWPVDVASVTFTLYAKIGANGTEAQADTLVTGQDVSQTITTLEGNASWTNLPNRVLVPAAEGTPAHWDDVTYSVKETEVTFVEGSGKKKLTTAEAVATAYGATWSNGTITNTSTTERHATKVWVGAPGTSVTFTLSGTYDNAGTETPVALADYGVSNAIQIINAPADDGQQWPTAHWTNLPVYTTDGKRITYSVAETPIMGYATNVSALDEDTKTWKITNTELTQQSISKQWEGTDDSKISSITYTLTRMIENQVDERSTVTIVKTKTGSAGVTEVLYSENENSWGYTWDNLPAAWRAVGTGTSGRYTYTVEETQFDYDGVTYNVNKSGNNYTVAPDSTAQGYDAAKAHNYWKVTRNDNVFTNKVNETPFEVTKQWDYMGSPNWPASVNSITLIMQRGTNSSGDTSITTLDNSFGLTLTVNKPTSGTGTISFAKATRDGITKPDASGLAALSGTVTEVKDENNNTVVGYKIHVEGLEDGFIYRVLESEVGGYTTTYWTEGSSAKPDAPDAYNGEMIKNTLITVILPATGGPGTTLYYAGGAVLILIALALFLRRKAQDE